MSGKARKSVGGKAPRPVPKAKGRGKAKAKSPAKPAKKAGKAKALSKSGTTESAGEISSGATRSRSTSKSGSGSRSSSRSSSPKPSPKKAAPKRGAPKKAAKSPKPKAEGSPKKEAFVLAFHGKGKSAYAQIGKNYISEPKISCYKQEFKDESKPPREVYKIHGIVCDERGKPEMTKDDVPKKSRHTILSESNLAIAKKHGLKCKPTETKPYKERAPKGTKKAKGKDPLRGQELTAKMIRALLRVYIDAHGIETLNDNIDQIKQDFATKKRT